MVVPAGEAPVRILRVIGRMNMGGPAHHVAILTKRLDPARFETLLVRGAVSRGEASLNHLLNPAKYQVIDLPRLGARIRPLNDLAVLMSLARIIRRYRPIIVHSHTAKAGLVARLAAMLAPGPRPLLVHTFHGHVLRGYFGRVPTAIYRLLERALARVTERLVCVSSANMEELLELHVGRRAQYIVVPVGLELEAFLDLVPGDRALRCEVGAAPDDVLAIFVGRLVPIKRVDVLLRSLAHARGLKAPVRLVVVGGGPLQHELEALASELGIAQETHFLGYREDVKELVSGSDVAVLSSSAEGTPVSLIQSGAGALPAVATAVGGVPEVVSDESGVLVQAGDHEALGRALAALAGDSSLRRRLGSGARERVRERFAAQRLVADVEALYATLLAPHGSTSGDAKHPDLRR